MQLAATLKRQHCAVVMLFMALPTKITELLMVVVISTGMMVIMMSLTMKILMLVPTCSKVVLQQPLLLLLPILSP